MANGDITCKYNIMFMYEGGGLFVHMPFVLTAKQAESLQGKYARARLNFPLSQLIAYDVINNQERFMRGLDFQQVSSNFKTIEDGIPKDVKNLEILVRIAQG